MLYKQELKKVPLCKPEKISKKELKDKEYVAGVQIVEVPRCGTTLIIDYYSIKDNSLQARFFSDSYNHIIFDVKNNEWKNKYVTTTLFSKETYHSDLQIVCSDSEYKKAHKFLNGKQGVCSVWVNGIYDSYGVYLSGFLAVTEQFIKQHRDKARETAIEKQEALFTERQLWFPKYDENIDRFCNDKIFDKSYVFFTTIGKNKKRKCTCSKCGHSWETSESLRHKCMTECPICHEKSLWWAERYETCISDTATLCTAYNHDKQLIMRWATVTRTFLGNKPYLSYGTDAYTLYLVEKGIPKIVSYFYAIGYMGYREHWTGARNGETCYHKAFVYSENLDETFGNKYYNVNLKSAMNNLRHPIDFIRLLDNLKESPATEYLLKMGLTTLAAELVNSDFADGKNFETAMGISKQYLPMYKKLDVNAQEHRLIRSCKEMVSEDVFEEFKSLGIDVGKYEQVEDIVQHMTLKTLCWYIKNQMLNSGENASRIVGWLYDYYGLCDDLDIPINKNTVRPKDLKRDHDVLTERYNSVAGEIKDKKSKAALELVNGWFKGYEKDGFCVVVPHYKSDFIREGQMLKHCVGRSEYYNNHIKGEKMIFFIRKSDKPDVPYVTCEVNMIRFRKCQCYGYGDKSPSGKCTAFVNDFIRWLSVQSKSLERKAG